MVICPSFSIETWAASRTARISIPFWPSVSAGWRVAMACKKAWHSSRKGFLKEGDFLAWSLDWYGLAFLAFHMLIIENKPVLDSVEDRHLVGAYDYNLWSFAPHDVALMNRLTGTMPESVSAFGGAYVQNEIDVVKLAQLSVSYQ